jgi:hypothetical protein
VQVADPAVSLVNLRDPRGEPAARVRDGADPVVQLASAVAALLLEAIARDEPAVLVRHDVTDLLGELSRPAPPGAHSRHEAVRHSRASGLLAVSFRRP